MLGGACPFRRPCLSPHHPALRIAQRGSNNQRRCFKTSPKLRDDQFPNHYETLGVQPGASEKDIKKQFYSMSKKYHPDANPNDPDASKRFVKISESYAILSSSTKRAAYDRDFARTNQQVGRQAPAYPSGSFSSAAASQGPGGRAPSGLSKRRTQFRGPPPSFYENGGWGAQGAKRSEYASQASHAWERTTQSQSGPQGAEMPGVGPGGFAHGLENDVPHFNSKGHYQTHSTIERTRHKARRRIIRESDDVGEGSGIIVGFLTISGVLLIGMTISGSFGSPIRSKEDRVGNG